MQILYFTAKWCGPCKTMAPIVAQAQSFVNIQKIDVEENTTATMEYGIRSVPTFIYLKDGREVGRKVGAMSLAEFQKIATSYK